MLPSLLLFSACSLLQSSPCPKAMVFIPMTDEAFQWGELIPSKPWHLPRQSNQTHNFCIDEYEFPNEKGTLPKAKVSWEEANKLCKGSNKRLCSEREWARACRGTKARKYAYGTQQQKNICNSDALSPEENSHPMASGSLSNCKSPEGVYDLNGNLSEWVGDNWRSFDHNQRRWRTAKTNHKTLRGGTMWAQTHYGQDCTSRHSHDASTWRNHDDGFRCCADSKP